MKIKVSLIVEVNPDEWDRTYGNGARPSEVRKDVRSYILNAIQCSAAAEETGMNIQLTR